MTKKSDAQIHTLLEDGPYKLFKYPTGLYAVDYITDSVGMTMVTTMDLEHAEKEFNTLALKERHPDTKPIDILALAMMQKDIHAYDVWDDADGQIAYVLTDCPPEQKDQLQKQFKANTDGSEGYDNNDFFKYLRIHGYTVIVMQRPSSDINLNDE